MYNKFKIRIFEIIESADQNDTVSRLFDIFIISLIILNVAAVMFGTVKEVSSQYQSHLTSFEFFSVIIFTIEYILRMWTCNVNPKFSGTFAGRLKYAKTPLAIIDILSILPFYLPMIIGMDLRFLRVMRIFRILLIFKFGRYSKSMNMIIGTLQSKKDELIATTFIIGVLLVLSSGLMYYAEHDAQPEVFSSIPASMWWGVATLTTVGYGDAYPITAIGKILGTIIAFLGIGMFALPTGILGSGFIEEIEKNKNNVCATECPHCGKDIN